MLVETYEQTETYDEEPENREAALALVSTLGLEGQFELLGEDENGGDMPYRKMTKEEQDVYGAILSVQTDIVDYKDAPIPLRILQVASHAQPLFDCLIVWHPKNADFKDPLLVGRKGDQYGPHQLFILARWGDELLPFPKLRGIAGKTIRDKTIASLKSIASEVTAHIAAVEAMTGAEVMASGFRDSPCFYK